MPSSCQRFQRLDVGRSRWRVTVVEQAAGPRDSGYMIAFRIGLDAAEAMGVLPRLQEIGYHVCSRDSPPVTTPCMVSAVTPCAVCTVEA
jgi:hypothetical protein